MFPAGWQSGLLSILFSGLSWCVEFFSRFESWISSSTMSRKTPCSYGLTSLCQAHLNILPNLRSAELGLELYLQNPFTPIPRLLSSE